MRPKTIVIETRIDVRDLATIAVYYKDKLGKVPSTKSELVRTIVEGFSDAIVRTGAYKIRSTEEALVILEGFNIFFRGVNMKFGESLLRQMQEEALEEDGFSLINNKEE